MIRPPASLPPLARAQDQGHCEHRRRRDLARLRSLVRLWLDQSAAFPKAQVPDRSESLPTAADAFALLTAVSRTLQLRLMQLRLSSPPCAVYKRGLEARAGCLESRYRPTA